MRQKSLFKRESREGEEKEGERRGERRRGFSIMKFEICRTSKASVAKPLWQQSRGGVHLFLSPPSLPLPFSLSSLSLLLSLLKCVSPELGEVGLLGVSGG